MLSHDASSQSEFQAAARSAWGSLFANMCPALRTLPLPMRARFVDRICKPLLRFRWVNWAWTASLARQVDTLQRHILQTVVALPPLWGELAADFVRRRANTIARVQATCGRWSSSYGADLVNWHAHCLRGRVRGLWSGFLLDWHDEAWLQTCRLVAHRGGALSRTGTRSLPGVVPRRWQAGLEHLKCIS